MYTIKLNEAKHYDVLIDKNFYQSELKKITSKYSCVFFLIDENLEINIKDSYQLKALEKNKSIDEAKKIINKMLELKIQRHDSVMVCIGGGITLDLGGFVASNYKRGIDVIYIPTTLLSMVDVAIGSKNGINISNYKNMFGNFYSPTKVIIDTNFLNTLPKRQYNSGIAEIIKYGCIYDENILKKLEGKFNIEDLIYDSLNVKKYFVENDPTEHGIRKYLNFGHTIGHAIEGYYNYDNYLHGEAISIGMNYVFKNERLESICLKYNLPTQMPVSYEELYPFLLNDKKNENGKIKFVKIKELGEIDV